MATRPQTPKGKREVTRLKDLDAGRGGKKIKGGTAVELNALALILAAAETLLPGTSPTKK